MGKAKVNTDLFMYTVPAAETGKAPEPRTAYRGEVIELDAAQEKRGRETLVNRDYPVAGGPQTVRAQEPALVDESFDADGAAVDAAKAARAEQLRAELAALGVDEPTEGGERRTRRS